MGSEPTLIFANLFFYCYESNLIKKIKNIDTKKARRFANTFRFIDYLAVLNEDDGEFEKNFQGNIFQNWNFRRRMISTQKVIFKMW